MARTAGTHRASSPATPATSPPGSPPTAGTATRSSPAATGSWSAGPARGPAGPIIVRRLLGLEDVLSMGICGPTHDERSWTFDLDPGGRDPVLGIERLQEAYFARFPDYDAGHHRAGDRRRADRPGGDQRLPADHPGPVDGVAAVPPRGRARPVPERAARRDRRGERAGLHATSTTASTGAGSPVPRRRTTSAYERLFDRAGLAVGPAGRPAVPGRRHDHRGRRAAVHHAGPLRRGLPRALQVQPAEAHRDAGAVGVRAGPVPDARVRRHRRLRPHQAALLRGAPRHQPDAASCRAGPDLSELARAARAGGARRARRSATAHRPVRPRRPRPCRPTTPRST